MKKILLVLSVCLGTLSVVAQVKIVKGNSKMGGDWWNVIVAKVNPAKDDYKKVCREAIKVFTKRHSNTYKMTLCIYDDASAQSLYEDSYGTRKLSKAQYAFIDKHLIAMYNGTGLTDMAVPDYELNYYPNVLPETKKYHSREIFKP